jgi:hypothetical protein
MMTLLPLSFLAFGEASRAEIRGTAMKLVCITERRLRGMPRQEASASVLYHTVLPVTRFPRSFSAIPQPPEFLFFRGREEKTHLSPRMGQINPLPFPNYSTILYHQSLSVTFLLLRPCHAITPLNTRRRSILFLAMAQF